MFRPRSQEPEGFKGHKNQNLKDLKRFKGHKNQNLEHNKFSTGFPQVFPQVQIYHHIRTKFTIHFTTYKKVG